MKDLIQYKFACTNAINEFLQGRYRRSQLISKLKEIENHYRSEIDDFNSDKGFWFRFFENDNLATTIHDIKKSLEQPVTHPIYWDIIENFNIAVDDASLQIYFS